MVVDRCALRLVRQEPRPRNGDAKKLWNKDKDLDKPNCRGAEQQVWADLARWEVSARPGQSKGRVGEAYATGLSSCLRTGRRRAQRSRATYAVIRKINRSFHSTTTPSRYVQTTRQCEAPCLTKSDIRRSDCSFN